jgi:hypothetical protein
MTRVLVPARAGNLTTMDEIEAILVDTPRRKSAEIALYFLSCTLAAHRVLSSYERRDSITVYRPCAVASCSVISTKGRNPCFEQGEKSFLDPHICSG